MLWNQLNKETQEHHITCVELFYRLHCLAPTANICEDIICHALLNPDKVSLCSRRPPSDSGPDTRLPPRPRCHVVACIKSFSRVQLFVALQTIARQAPLSVGFSKQEYWRGLPCSPPGDLPNPGIEPESLTLQADSLPSELSGKPSGRLACIRQEPFWGAVDILFNRQGCCISSILIHQ